MEKTVPFHRAAIGQEEIDEVVDTLRSGWLTMGPKTLAFEEAFSSYLDVPFAVSLNSATAALHLALKAIGLQSGDEVILPAITFVSTAEVVTYFNAKPVLCDVEQSTHNLDVSHLKTLITPKTKAIIPVHFSGIPCDMDEIMDLAKANQLTVIEDAAHAIPSLYKGKKVGTLGDITCFSFYATKTLTTGEGGMLVTPSSEIAGHVKRNRLHGISKDAWDRYTLKGSWAYDVVDNGWKYNMTDIAASLGINQLRKVDKMHQQRKRIAARYDDYFKPEGVDVLNCPADRDSSHHLYVIKVKKRDELMAYLKEKKIGCSVHFIPIHHFSYYQNTYGYHMSDYAVANDVFSQSLSLPIFPDMTDDEIEYVVESVLSFLK